MSEVQLFYRCRNCGRIVPSPSIVGDGFCSADCAVLYTNCTTCGRYFEQTKGSSASTCSAECDIKYSVRLSERVLRALKEEE